MVTPQQDRAWCWAFSSASSGCCSSTASVGVSSSGCSSCSVSWGEVSSVLSDFTVASSGSGSGSGSAGFSSTGGSGFCYSRKRPAFGVRINLKTKYSKTQQPSICHHPSPRSYLFFHFLDLGLLVGRSSLLLSEGRSELLEYHLYE